MYDNIGGKIKGLAKAMFIVEALGAIITGIVLLCNEIILAGLLILFCGPIVAWVGSWILYAFGQFVEDIHAIRDREGTTTEVKTKREAEAKAKRETEIKARTQGDYIKRKTYVWDHWDETASSYGQCELCKKKGVHLLFVAYEDSDGKHQKNICYDCFCERDCSPVE